MKLITDFIFEQYYGEFAFCEIINEENVKIFPPKGKFAKFSWYAGDHAGLRQKERKVSNKEITDAIFSAYDEIKKLFSDGNLKISKNGEDSNAIIIDARKDRQNPTCICIFIESNASKTNLKYPKIIVKTVFKKTEENQSDFSALMRAAKGKSRKEEKIIWLY